MSENQVTEARLRQQMQRVPLIQSIHGFGTFFWQLLVRKWLILFCGSAVFGLVGIFYAYMQPVKYESRLLFALDEGGTGSGSGGLLSLASQFGFNMGSGNEIFGGDNIMTILQSRNMIEQTLLSADTIQGKPKCLIDIYLDDNKLRNPNQTPVTYRPGQVRSAFSYQQDSVLYKIYEDFATELIKIWKPDKYLNLYEVRVVSTNERFSKIFTERLVHETNNYYTEIRSRKGRETLEILEARVADMKGNLFSNLSSKATTQDANINPAFSAAQVPAQRSQANIQTYGAAYAEMFKNLELARFQYLKQIPLMQIIDEAKYPMKKIKVGKLKTGIITAFLGTFLLVCFFWVRTFSRQEKEHSGN